MAQKSAIEWTGSTWNPVTGCVKVSPGCMHCYAERMAQRLQAMGQSNYANGFKLVGAEHLDGRDCGKQGLHFSHRPSSQNRGVPQISLDRAASRSDIEPESGRHRLGNCWW